MPNSEGKKIQIKILLNVSFFVTLSSVFISFFLLINFFNHLKNDKLISIEREVENNLKFIENSIEKYIDLSKQIGSRTMIRKKLEEYNNNLVTEKELYDYSFDKLKDSIKQIDNIESLIRFSKNNTKLVTIGEKFGNEVYEDLINENQFKIKGPLHFNNKYYIVINSIIKNENDEYIGKDIIIFNIKELIDFFNKNSNPIILNDLNNIIFKNITAEKIEKIDLKKNETENMLIIRKEINFINTKFSFIVYKDDFYKNIKKEVIIVILITLFFILLSILITLIILYPLTGKIIVREGYLIDEINKKTEEIKKEINLKNIFYKIIAHDLKNPISANINFIELILDDLKKQDFNKNEIIYNLDILKKNSDNIFLLLENILLWSESQNSYLKINKEKFKIYDIIETNINLLNQNIKEKNIKIIIEGDKDCILNADKNTIDTVIRNLLSNAIKFTYDNGRIIFNIIDEKDSIIIKITDNGVGIAEDKLLKIFEYNTSKTTKGTKGEIGTGLGLLLCKEFIEKNEGKIKIESTISKGTTTIIEFK